MRNSPTSLVAAGRVEMLIVLIVLFNVFAFVLGSSLPANHDIRFFR